MQRGTILLFTAPAVVVVGVLYYLGFAGHKYLEDLLSGVIEISKLLRIPKFRMNRVRILVFRGV